MPTAQSSATGRDQLREAAALLVVLGDEISGLILKELEPEEVRALAREMIHLPEVPRELADKALRGFQGIFEAQKSLSQGGTAFARRALACAFGEDAAAEHLVSATVAGGSSSNSGNPISSVPPEQLALLLKNEHPQTAALLLSRLGVRHAASVLGAFPPELRPEVLYRLATIDQISPEVVDQVLSSLEKKLKTLASFNRESLGGRKLAAQLCNSLQGPESDQMLCDIEGRDENLAKELRNLMFVFEDLLRLEDDVIKEIVPKLDRKSLLIALRGSSEKLRDHICKTMSKRAASMLLEELESLGPIKIRDVELAQGEIIESLREMEREGLISLRADSGEEYVK